jgi:hypothetical protein
MGWIFSPAASPEGRKNDGSPGDDINEKRADSLSIVEDATPRNRWKQRAVRLGHRLNPFYVDDPPPVPDGDAGLVPECTANWFEKLTFGWLAPLMFVRSPKNISANQDNNSSRKVIDGHFKRKIYGIGTMHGLQAILPTSCKIILINGLLKGKRRINICSSRP